MDILNYAATKRYHDALICHNNLKFSTLTTSSTISTYMTMDNQPIGAVGCVFPTTSTLTKTNLFNC